MKFMLSLIKNGPCHAADTTAIVQAAMPLDCQFSGLYVILTQPGELDPSKRMSTVKIYYEREEGLTPQEIADVQAALDGHDGAVYLNRQEDLKEALPWKKGQLANVDWSATPLSVAERKLILNQPLSEAEEDAILVEWENS